MYSDRCSRKPERRLILITGEHCKRRLLYMNSPNGIRTRLNAICRRRRLSARTIDFVKKQKQQSTQQYRGSPNNEKNVVDDRILIAFGFMKKFIIHTQLRFPHLCVFSPNSSRRSRVHAKINKRFDK